MQTLSFLNLVISILFIYLILSLVASSIQELVASFLKLRSKNLAKWISDTFDNEFHKLGQMILKHPVVDGLTHKNEKGSYLPAREFVTALFDSVVNGAEAEHKVGTYTIDDLKKAIETTPLLEVGMKNYLLQTFTNTNNDIKAIRKEIELWYDKANERIAGTYKRHTQKIILIISIVLCGFANADTIAFVKYFNTNPEQAKQVANLSEKFVADSALIYNQERLRNVSFDSTDTVTVKQFIKTADSIMVVHKKYIKMLEETKIPLGWEEVKVSELNETSFFFKKLIGILLTAFAVSLGAPFWFEMLNKLVNLRSSGNFLVGQKKNEEKKDKGK